MRRDRFMLDTNAVLFYLKDSPRLPKWMRESISYNHSGFFVSVLSIIEIVNKTQSGRVLLTKRLTVDKLVLELENLGIEVLPYKTSDLFGLFDLPYFRDHADPMDRAIFSHAIAQHCILITTDKEFQRYDKNLQKYLFPI